MRIGDFMKSRRGFTLIEIIGVIALLAVILLVAAPTIIKTLKSTEDSEYSTYVENITLAAETYLQRNRERYPQLEHIGGIVTITVGTLQEEGFVKKNLKNPKTDANVNEADYIEVTVQSDGSYTYKYKQA